MKRVSHTFALFVLILLVGLSAHSQSLFEIKFTDKQKVQYTGFLVFFNETNAYMRIAYNLDSVYNVVNVTYTSKNGINKQGTKYSMLKGYNPVFITTNTTNRSYNPDYFMWFFNNATQKWGTPYTTDDSLLNPNNYVHVDSYTQLEPKNINDQYLRRYFGNYESEYFSLKKMCGLTLTDVNPVVANKLYQFHLVIIANTLDPTIGAGCAADETNLKNEFRQISDALGFTFQQYIVDGSAFSKEKVLATLNSLSPGNNDIVVFIYRGHGFRWKNQTSDWPRMDLRTSAYDSITDSHSMNLAEVYSLLKSKGARLNIILGDCCNSEVNAAPVTTSNYLNFQFDNNSDISKLKDLFLKSNGIILSSAAQKGEVSWVTSQGGLYSMSFLQALREDVSYLSTEECKWDNIITKTIKLARSKSTPTFCSNCSTQNGIKYVSVVE
ncbi:MAG: caspase family protein [Bacteroidia bacterium]|nr:caspase family protein [Bacteroidia bacterium]